jgi:hypothetical protein
VFVNSADGGALLASCYGCFVCMERCLDHTGLAAGRVLAIVANINVSFPCREQSRGTRSHSVLYQLCRTCCSGYLNIQEEIMRYCRKLHNLKLHNLHCLQSIVTSSKSIWAGCVACISDYWGKIQIYVEFRLRNLKGGGLLEDVSVDRRVMSS